MMKSVRNGIFLPLTLQTKKLRNRTSTLTRDLKFFMVTGAIKLIMEKVMFNLEPRKMLN